MGLIQTGIDIILHMDKYLSIIIEKFGLGAYIFLFLIFFAETGLVIIPFLPGDSLLFVAGTLSSQGFFNIWILFILLSLAVILGDTFNYWLGKYFGERISRSKLIKKEYLQKTKDFYKEHGGKTIIFARFIPIIRTFAPFIAGVGKMNYLQFLSFNIIGGISWVTLFLFSGYFFGSIQFVRDNLTYVIFGIIFVSIIPPIYHFIKKRK